MAIAVMSDTHKLLIQRIKSLREEIDRNKQDIKEAAAHGDLSENAEYDSAKERQSMLHYKLNQLQMYMNVEIFNKEDIITDRVSFGTSIQLKDLNSGDDVHYNLLGPAELELENYPDIMTYTSPLAKVLIGKKEGEIAEIKREDKHLKFEIQDIQSAWRD